MKPKQINNIKREIYTLIKKYDKCITPKSYVLFRGFQIKRVNSEYYKVLHDNSIEEDYMGIHDDALPDNIDFNEKIIIMDTSTSTFTETTNRRMIMWLHSEVKEWAKQVKKVNYKS
jgi:hypothetical protein